MKLRAARSICAESSEINGCGGGDSNPRTPSGLTPQASAFVHSATSARRSLADSLLLCSINNKARDLSPSQRYMREGSSRRKLHLSHFAWRGQPFSVACKTPFERVKIHREKSGLAIKNIKIHRQEKPRYDKKTKLYLKGQTTSDEYTSQICPLIHKEKQKQQKTLRRM